MKAEALRDNPALREELDAFIEKAKSEKGALIPVLHKAQQIYGYLPEEVMAHIAERLGLPASKVFGVVTFYSFFSTKPKGRFDISVCLGTACFVRGSEQIVSEFEKQLKIKQGFTSEDGMFSLGTVRCVGACGLAPVVMVNGRVYGRVGVSDVARIIEDCMKADGEANGQN